MVVDLESLLDKIFVAPLSEDWYVNLVKSVVSKYGIAQDKVVKSNLYYIYLVTYYTLCTCY